MRHESAAVAAADAFHRAGGGVVYCHHHLWGWLTNTISTLAEAKAAYSAGLRRRHPPSPAAPLRPGPVGTPRRARGVLSHCLPKLGARRCPHRRGVGRLLREPVVIQLPFDIQEAPLIDDGETPKNIHLLDATTTGAQHASGRLATATDGHRRRALDILHHNGEEDCRRLARLATATDCGGSRCSPQRHRKIVDSLAQRRSLVMHSAMARHALDSPWELGTVGGFAHSWQVELAQQADVVLVLGASFNVFQTRGGNMFAPSSHIIHIVDEPHPASQHVDKRLFSQLEEVLPVLGNCWSPNRPGRRWREEMATPPQPMPAPPATTCADGRLDPRARLAQLNRIVPSARAVCTDGGHFLGWVPKYLDVPGPHSQVIVGTAIQSIGMGMGSLVGLAAARPDDYCILVAGDGGALMGLADLPAALATLRRGAIVIMNDAAYGAELHQYAGAGLDTSSWRSRITTSRP